MPRPRRAKSHRCVGHLPTRRGATPGPSFAVCARIGPRDAPALMGGLGRSWPSGLSVLATLWSSSGRHPGLLACRFGIGISGIQDLTLSSNATASLRNGRELPPLPERARCVTSFVVQPRTCRRKKPSALKVLARNCDSFGSVAFGGKVETVCDADSDFYGYALTKGNQLCSRWRRKNDRRPELTCGAPTFGVGDIVGAQDGRHSNDRWRV